MSFTDGVFKSLDNTKQETEIGIGGYRIFAKTDESTNYSNIVPVDVLEDGSNSTDDILNNPIQISISGVIGDLFIEPANYPELISRDFSAVGEVVSLLPAKSQQQVQRISQIDSQLRSATLLAQRAERIGNQAYEFFNNSASNAKSQQDKFIEYMESVYYSRKAVSLSTSFRDYKNMALSDLTISKNNQDGEIKFSAEFIQINYLSLIYVPIAVKYSSPSSSIAGKVSDAANKGGQNPEVNTEKSLLSSIFGG